MSEEQFLSIGEVAKLTGLTDRALRFYEEKGLIAPYRTEAGRRVYGEDELLRLHQVVLLKRADFSLRKIKELLVTHEFDANAIIDARISVLEEERTEIDDALAGLRSAKATVDAGGHLDVETLCTMIQQGGSMMSDKAWQKVFDKFYTPKEQEVWKEAKGRMPTGFDQAEYERKWKDLGSRIEAALPLDPKSEKGAAFLAEWQALLEPFTTVANDQMTAGAANLWDNMDSWPDGVESPFSKQVWEFIKSASREN